METRADSSSAGPKKRQTKKRKADDDDEDYGGSDDNGSNAGGSRGPKRGHFNRSSSKTYEEPSKLPVLKSTQIEWIGIEAQELDQCGCLVVRECFTFKRIPYTLTFIGKRGRGVVFSGNTRVELLCTPEASTAMIMNAALAANGYRVAAATDSYVVYLWDISNLQDPRILYAVHTSARAESINRGEVALALSASGDFLMVHERDSPIFVWSPNQTKNRDGVSTTAKIMATLQGPPSRGFGQSVTAATFSSDLEEKTLFACFLSPAAGEIKHYDCCVYDLAPGLNDFSARFVLSYPIVSLRGHDARITNADYCGVTKSLHLATADTRAFGWNLLNNRCKMFCSNPTNTEVQHVVAIADGAHVATATSDGFVRIWGCYPAYPRSSRGYVPLVCRLTPPAVVCKKDAYMVHLAYEHVHLGIAVIWKCNENAERVPEPVSDNMDGTHTFGPPSDSRVGGATAGLNGSAEPATEGRRTEKFLVTLRYSRIPCIVNRYRSDVALQMKHIAKMHKMTNDEYKKSVERILDYLV